MSLLIASKKDATEIDTLRLNTFKDRLCDCQIDGSEGLSVARNKLARKALTSALFFIDDDVKLENIFWENIDPLDLKDNHIYMCQGDNHPISRVMLMTKETFEKIGGFDETIKYNGEDYDFFLTAMKRGVPVTLIPRSWTRHLAHKKDNWIRYNFESPYVRIKHHKCGVNFFVHKNPIVMFLRITGYFYYKFWRK